MLQFGLFILTSQALPETESLLFSKFNSSTFHVGHVKHFLNFRCLKKSFKMLGKIWQKFLPEKQTKKIKGAEKLHLNIFCVFEKNKPSPNWALRPEL